MKKIAFVVPWYGDKIPGGAETETRNIVKNLTKKEIEVEILTTCVEKFSSDWNKNYYKEGNYEESGIKINSEVTNELIINIFIPNTPLHDGAMIIDRKSIRAASCVLPLSDNRSIASSYGTRHRAALGLSELTDSIIIVVSEETGKISICQNGRLVTDFSEKELTKYLEENWQQSPENLI